MSATTHNKLKLGSITKIDKVNASRGTQVGQYMVCTAVFESPTNPATLDSGTYEVYDTEEHASERAAQTHNDHALLDASSAITIEGLLSTHAAVKRSDLHHFTSKWKELTESTPPPPTDPIHGKRVKTMLYLPDKHGVSAFVTVEADCTLETSLTPNAYSFKGTFDGVPFDVSIDKSGLSPADVEVVTAPLHVTYSLGFDSAFASNLIFKLVKVATLSAATSANSLDAHDLLTFFQAYEPASKWDSMSLTAPGHAADRSVVMALASAFSKLAPRLETPSACARTWPPQPDRLAKEIVGHLKASGGVAKHPLASALMAKAATGEWDSFLQESYVHNELVAPSKHSYFASASDYVLTGTLDKYLAKYAALGCPSGTTPLQAIQALDDDLSKDDLDMWMIDLGSKTAPSAPPGLSGGGGGGGAPPMPMLGGGGMPSVMPPGWPPLAINANPLANPGGGMLLVKETAGDSESDQCEYTTIRADAEAVGGSQHLIDSLAAMTVIKNTQPALLPAMLEGTPAKPTSPHLTRLIQFNGNLAAVLQGKWPNLANECVNIRAILEKRLFESVMDLGEEATARQKTALRHARLGRLPSMRVFHLVDHEDKGSKEQPMAQLSKLKSKLEQTSLVIKAFRMLERILSVAFPAQQAQLLKFLGSFAAKIEKFIDDNMPMATLNYFVMNVFKKMCTPAEQYRIAERSTPYIAVNDEWIGVQRSFMDKVNAGHMLGLAGTKRGGEPSLVVAKEPKLQPKKSGEETPSKPKAKGKTYKKEEEMEAGRDGKYDGVPCAGHPVLIKWNRDQGKEGDKWKCWAHSNLRGGCLAGDKCRNVHVDV